MGGGSSASPRPHPTRQQDTPKPNATQQNCVLGRPRVSSPSRSLAPAAPYPGRRPRAEAAGGGGWCAAGWLRRAARESPCRLRAGLGQKLQTAYHLSVSLVVSVARPIDTSKCRQRCSSATRLWACANPAGPTSQASATYCQSSYQPRHIPSLLASIHVPVGERPSSEPRARALTMVLAASSEY